MLQNAARPLSFHEVNSLEKEENPGRIYIFGLPCSRRIQHRCGVLRYRYWF